MMVLVLLVAGPVVDTPGNVAQRVPVVTSVLASVAWVALSLAIGRGLTI